MIGEALGRWFMRRFHRRQKQALRDTCFDGVCPNCGGQMQFTRRGEDYASCPQDLFICHGCRSRLWKLEFDPDSEASYRLIEKA